MITAIRRLGAVFACVVLIFSGSAIAAEEGAQKAVLVTGASTGIGRRITEVLAEEGYFVYAGARKQADIDALNAIANVQAVKLDVTVQAEIDAAVATVEAGGLGLYGLMTIVAAIFLYSNFTLVNIPNLPIYF